MRRVRLLASGTVQGVFFRASVVERAGDLAVTGWVRNTADGRVELEAQGSPEAVEAFVAFCRAGPGEARVTDLRVEDVPAVRDEPAFDVRR